MRAGSGSRGGRGRGARPPATPGTARRAPAGRPAAWSERLISRATNGLPAHASWTRTSSGRGWVTPEPVVDEPAEGADGQRPYRDALAPLGREGRLQLGRGARRGDGPAGEHERDRFPAQPARGEGERARGRRVAPLDVIDRDHERAGRRERSDEVEHGEPDEPGSRRPPGCLDAAEGELEGPPARWLERVERRVLRGRPGAP